jgi:phytanoyl-CoA hydroxylase
MSPNAGEHVREHGRSAGGGRFSSAELEAFRRDGYVVVRALVPPRLCAELAALARGDLEAARAPLELEAELRYPGAPVSREAPGGQTVRRLLQAYSRHEAWAGWARSPALAGRLGQLFGPRVVLSQAHHNCIMTKSPRYSSATGWHRDVRYWRFERPELVSVWLALGREERRNGCLLVLPGTHRVAIDSAQLDAAEFLRPDLPENAALLARARPVELEAGDTLFFDARLFHAASSNATAEIKFSAVFTYHAADNRPLPGTRSASLPEIELPQAGALAADR